MTDENNPFSLLEAALDDLDDHEDLGITTATGVTSDGIQFVIDDITLDEHFDTLAYYVGVERKDDEPLHEYAIRLNKKLDEFGVGSVDLSPWLH